MKNVLLHGMRCALYMAVFATLILGDTARAATIPVPFIFFNNTRFTNRTLLDAAGTLRSAVVYDVWGLTCTATGCSNVPTQSAFTTVLDSYVADSTTGSSGGYGSSFMIILDFEDMVIDKATSTAQATQEATQFLQFASWVHTAYPRALVGIYDYDWNSNYASVRATLYQSGGLTVFAPSMYQRWSSYATWKSELDAAIANDRQISSTIPIYPYVSPFVSGDVSKGLMSTTEWQEELSDLIDSVNGAILWSGPSTITTVDGWYTSLLDVLSPPIDTSSLYAITNEHNGLCAEAQGITDGSTVDQKSCPTTKTLSEKWQFQETSQGIYTATNASSSQSYMSVDGSSVASGAGVVLHTENTTSGPDANQTWRIVSAGKKYYSKGYYLLVGQADDQCVTAPASGAGAQLAMNPLNSQTTQMYTILPQ